MKIQTIRSVHKISGSQQHWILTPLEERSCPPVVDYSRKFLVIMHHNRAPCIELLHYGSVAQAVRVMDECERIFGF